MSRFADKPEDFLLNSYQFKLPDELIAQSPAAQRDASRLMVLGPDSFEHNHFRDLPNLVSADWHLVFNDTKVLPARLLGQTRHGGKAEVLLVQPVEDDLWSALVRPGRKLKMGARIEFFGANFSGEIIAVEPNGNRIIKFSGDLTLDQYMEAHGHVPLPPYINRGDIPLDQERYQTVYASNPGSVAAPTAGLHFTKDLIAAIEKKGASSSRVTLNVGPGTFRPVSSENIRDHQMHSERFEISPEEAHKLDQARQEKRKIVAVGTTSVRVLESLAETQKIQPRQGETDLFIFPGYKYRLVNGLITNFHLPGSSLLMLVSALTGRTRLLNAYQSAIDSKYRFFSYGDAMLIPPRG